MDLNQAMTTSQSYSLVPEVFQESLIENISRKLLSCDHPPCLLRAPTGSGKTFVVSKVLGNISAERDTIWFWFVPYVNLVNQTLDALITNAGDLSPVLFNYGVNQNPSPGQVLISTTQGVSRATWRRQNYDAGGGELSRTPAEFVSLIRANELNIGVVVDEAHIALDEATEFGKFINWLNPNFLAMATATPKSDRINQFLASAGMSGFESFNVSRDEVVEAMLNKAFIEAIVYDLNTNTATIADLKATVLKQAWNRNLSLKSQLEEACIPIKPLLLVQVENGADSIKEAELELVQNCKVSPHAIGIHSSDEPNPKMMDAIANDSSKEVLIFKQSAGTGFDAPRAFVLASTKPVNDQDFAMQFIGRVMRVAKQIRQLYQRTEDIPIDLNTAYIYLADAQAQTGFQSAISATMAIQSELEGQIEKMDQRKTRSGATAFTNRPSSQEQISHHWPIRPPKPIMISSGSEDGAGSEAGQPVAPQRPPGKQGSFFSEETLDSVLEDPCQTKKPNPFEAESQGQWEQDMIARGILAYPLNRQTPELPKALSKEERPAAIDMANLTRMIATRLELSTQKEKEAVLAARSRLKGTEIRTELTKREFKGESQVRIAVDRNRIARHAYAQMRNLPQLEEEDQRILVETLANRIRPRLEDSLEEADVELQGKEVARMARTAAHFLIIAHIPQISEAIYAEIANQAETKKASPLPDFMLFPAAFALAPSRKSLYSILPPTKDDLDNLASNVLMEDRILLQEGSWRVKTRDGTRELMTGKFDHSFVLNKDEYLFAQALDRADFVVWWFRNPDKKSYSVRLVRGEHRNYFYPDFVVCLSHVVGDRPSQRLIETKHDLKDAIRKAKHIPEFYGQVIFLTKDNGQYRLVTDEGGIGDVVDFNDLETLRVKLQQTMPMPQE